MPFTPGIQVKVESSGSAPIAGVGTSTAAFVLKVAEQRNLPGTATLVTSYDKFAAIAKDLKAPAVLRDAEAAVATADAKVVAVKERFGDATDAQLAGIAEAAARDAAALAKSAKYVFEAMVTKLGSAVEVLDKPATAAAEAARQDADKAAAELRKPNSDTKVVHDAAQSAVQWLQKIVTDVNGILKQEMIEGFTSTEARAREAAAAVLGFFLNGGTRCYVAFYTGTVGAALTSFSKIDEVAIVAAPGASPTDAQSVIGHCEALEDRFAVLDGLSGEKWPEFARVSGYAAYYYPWIEVQGPFDGRPCMVPPSGHVAGVYARVDATRGVHKAPANEVIRGATGVEIKLSPSVQDTEPKLRVNVIRDMQGSVRIWGARTLSDVSETQYINVRRTLLFLRESIEEGLQWVVFEPNTPALWSKVCRNIGAFLHDVWASGALFGTTAEQAYYVRCDEELNPPSMRENGQLNIEIGVALVRPAEFITITIRPWSGPGK